jgi:DNA ligase-1
MIDFGRTCAAIAATASRLEKITLVADYLATLSDADVAPAARYFSGNPFAQADERSIAIGGRTIIDAALDTWRIDAAALSLAYRATGDLGAALGPFVAPANDLGLFRQTLTPANLYALLIEIADATGKHARKRRRFLCERILAACTEPVEATYVIKVLTGELRIGLREGLVVDAIAQAFAREAPVVRRAAAGAGDLGAVALAAKHDALAGLAIAYHAPIGFMLASPLAYESDFTELASSAWLVEDKYDGVRAQAHVTNDRVSIFSRTLNDVASAFPEVVAALRTISGSFAFDGEIVAMRDGRVLPFRFLQARLQRKVVAPEMLAEIPVRFAVFDLLAAGDEFLLDLPLAERRARLAEVLRADSDALERAPWTTLEAGATAATIRERFARAREAGHEGLVFKQTDSRYTPGRRGKAWRKLKRELATLDCVVVAVERGHGRRINVLSDYTFAVRSGTALAVIGKAYSGLTDAEIAEMTVWFEAHRLSPDEAIEAYGRLALKRREIMVAPLIVVEIAFDIVQRSELHASGFSLRFPRIVRLRPDKLASDADTLARVAEIHAEMIAREQIGE